MNIFNEVISIGHEFWNSDQLVLPSLINSQLSLELDMIRLAIDMVGEKLKSLKDVSMTSKALPFFTTFLGAYFAYLFQKSRSEEIEKVNKSDALNKVLQTHVINLQILLSYKNSHFSELKNEMDAFSDFLEEGPFHAEDFSDGLTVQYQLMLSDMLGKNPTLDGVLKRWEIPELAVNDLKDISFATNVEPDCIRFSYLAAMWSQSFIKELEHRQKILASYRETLKSDPMFPTHEMREAMTEIFSTRRVVNEHATYAIILMHAANLLILRYHRNHFPAVRKKRFRRAAKRIFIVLFKTKDKTRFREKYRKAFKKKVPRLSILRYSGSIFSQPLPEPDLVKNYLMPSYYFLKRNWHNPEK